ncbi:cell wall-binding repeat-containing protein, partial [uncultured Phycicoccus sp.]|uniref:cell wall-binding repeat-containing protein n=1 Tax=uncultured Phycicoccus sp. TaxID=661422 RepID=UPI002608E3AF
ELTRLKPQRIVVLGGTGSVSAAVADDLRRYTTGDVTRLSGTDRYAASATISARTFDPGVPVAYVATGSKFPDALSGAPAAGVQRGPVLLVRSGGIPTPIADELTRLKPQRIVVLGGTGSVSAAVADALAAYVTD